jgi:hypothetical protein
MMAITSDEVTEYLGGLDPEILREMVYQTAQSHVRVCELTSVVGGCAHTDAETIRERVEDLSPKAMTAILVPITWMAVDLHRRIGNR